MEKTENKVGDVGSKVADIGSHVEEFADTWYKLTVVNATEKATSVASAAISMIMLCTVGVFVFVLGGLALAWWLGDLIGSRAGGFLLAAGFFGLIMVVIILLRKRILFPFFRDLIIRKLYD